MPGIEGNRHHILHYNEYWRANKDNNRLRRSLGLIALIDVDTHRELHRACPAPPSLDPFTAARTVRLYEPTPNPLQGIDNFRFAVEQAMRHERSHDIEQQIAMLTIEAVTLQLPFIRRGLISDDQEY